MKSHPFLPVVQTPRCKPHIYKNAQGWWSVRVPTFGAMPIGSTVKAYKFVNSLTAKEQKNGNEETQAGNRADWRQEG